MSIKLLYIGYWVLLHAVVGGGLALLLWDDRPWMLAVEAGLLASLGVALYLSRQLLKPVEVMREGLNLIKDQDLATHFVPEKQEELRLLVDTYNRMLEKLREERRLLQEKQYFLEKIVQASQTGLLLLDYDGRVAMANPSALDILGGSMHDWQGKPLELLPYPFGEALSGLEAGGTRLLTLASRKRVKCTKSEFFDQGFARAFVMLDELTEELRLSEKAAYEKLIRVISHEINNSLGAVSSLLHTCLHYGEQLEAEDREDYEMAIRVMISRSDHLGSFMGSYADVIRLARPKKVLCDVEQLLRDISALFKAQLAERNIVLYWDVHVLAEPKVAIDRLQIEQVLVNVLKNAMEAVERDGRISIGILPHGKQTLVCIEDSGPGIPPEVRENLFTPFFSTKPQGQGIGLTMIQEILVQHDFEFSLDSPEPGRTQFKIWMD